MISSDVAKIISTTESLCPHCLEKIVAYQVQQKNNIYLVKQCPEHGSFKTIIWRGNPPFQSWFRPKVPTKPRTAFTTVEKGCPYDCGLCNEHRQHTCTALLEVTNRCNLKCSFCFANAGEQAVTEPDLKTIRFWYQRLLEAGGPYNVQLSGGEPTMRDDLPQIVALGKKLGFNFIQINTNGIRLTDKKYVKELKEAGLSSIYLQFDGTEEEIYIRLRDRPLLKEKIVAIDNCTSENIGVVLVPTLVPGVNTHNIGEMIKWALNYIPTVRGIHFQPVSYFGRYPQAPTDRQRITIPEVINEICAQTDGSIRIENFLPPGCENALCSFHGNFVLMPDGKLTAWSKRQGSCCNDVELAEEGSRKARNFVSRYWSASQIKLATQPAHTDIDFGGWDVFLQRVKSHSFTISGMAFQDVWNVDLERVRDCCIHVINPVGNMIPFCMYNITNSEGKSLYRQGYRT